MNVRHAAFVMHVGHWAGDPQCPGRPVNVIELDDVSVQVDVSDVRLLNSSACNKFHGCWSKRGSPRCHRTLQLASQELAEPGSVHIARFALTEASDTPLL